MTISIHPALPSDAPGMLDAGIPAFQNDALSNAHFQHKIASPETLEEYRQYRIALTRLRMDGVGKYWFKAVDDASGRIVGYTGFYSPEAEPVPFWTIPRPEQNNSEVDDELREKLEESKKKNVGDRKDVWYVQSMAVHPDYQGQNIATRLLQRGLEDADKAGQDTYLEGTAAAQKLYKRCGFETCDDISFLNGQYIMKAMIRHAQNTSQNGR